MGELFGSLDVRQLCGPGVRLDLLLMSFQKQCDVGRESAKAPAPSGDPGERRETGVIRANQLREVQDERRCRAGTLLLEVGHALLEQLSVHTEPRSLFCRVSRDSECQCAVENARGVPMRMHLHKSCDDNALRLPGQP